jgi:hypothetical protein
MVGIYTRKGLMRSESNSHVRILRNDIDKIVITERAY